MPLVLRRRLLILDIYLTERWRNPPQLFTLEMELFSKYGLIAQKKFKDNSMVGSSR